MDVTFKITAKLYISRLENEITLDLPYYAIFPNCRTFSNPKRSLKVLTMTCFNHLFLTFPVIQMFIAIIGLCEIFVYLIIKYLLT